MLTCKHLASGRPDTWKAVTVKEPASLNNSELLSLKRTFSKLPTGAVLNGRDRTERLEPLKKGVRWLLVAFEIAKLSKYEEVKALGKHKVRLHRFQLLLQSPH